MSEETERDPVEQTTPDDEDVHPAETVAEPDPDPTADSGPGTGAGPRSESDQEPEPEPIPHRTNMVVGAPHGPPSVAAGSSSRTLFWVGIAAIAYSALCALLYVSTISYGPVVLGRMAALGWISIDSVPYCEVLGLTDCMDSCACRVCLGPPPPHLADQDIHSWRCIGVSDYCDSGEIPTAEGCVALDQVDIELM
jgi:hypothetical protein